MLDHLGRMQEPQPQQLKIEREVSYPSFGWQVARLPDGLVRLILITGSTAHIFPMNGIDFARFKRDCEQASPTSDMN